MSLRRSARLCMPATSPEERLVPLVERGLGTNSGPDLSSGGPQESHPSPAGLAVDVIMSGKPYEVYSSSSTHRASGLRCQWT